MRSADDKPICGRDLRLRWLRAELDRQLKKPFGDAVALSQVLAWYMRSGDSLGFAREELLFSLTNEIALLTVAEELSEAEILDGKPPPDFSRGQHVEVVVGARNTTYHCGTVEEMSWHHKDGVWHYRIVEAGRRVSKRYEARDLRRVGSESTVD